MRRHDNHHASCWPVWHWWVQHLTHKGNAWSMPHEIAQSKINLFEHVYMYVQLCVCFWLICVSCSDQIVWLHKSRPAHSVLSFGRHFAPIVSANLVTSWGQSGSCNLAVAWQPCVLVYPIIPTLKVTPCQCSPDALAQLRLNCSCRKMQARSKVVLAFQRTLTGRCDYVA